jgi:molecular chaperone HtpG
LAGFLDGLVTKLSEVLKKNCLGLYLRIIENRVFYTARPKIRTFPTPAWRPKSMSVDAHKETRGFETEIKQLLDIVIHSLYSNKEIFLRELISNASDANDKLRFAALSDDALYEGEGDLKIWLEFNQEQRTITVRDNGIGMNRDEVSENIGTIAKSGTKAFFGALSGDQAKDSHLIGQFGVGFYSSFIIADKVTLITRKAGMSSEHGVRWESGGDGEYTIENIERAARGTEVTLHLREGEDEFLDEFRLRGIVKKYSDHITFPVLMQVQKHDDENDETTISEEQINSTQAIWQRNKNDIKDEEYHEFYKHIAHDFENPLSILHNRVEGNLEYTSLMFIPARAPFDLWDRQSRHGIKLYVRRVFIMDDAEHLLPVYLRFVRGVIDSSDLPLNVSREILQSNKQIDSIRSGTVKKILSALESMANNEAEQYKKFWKEFGRVLKEGIIDDFSNRERIAKLLRFSSTHNDNIEPTVSLSDYIARMPEGQDKIYYITGENFNAAKSSPHLEIFRKKGIEVLLLHDAIDEWVVTHLNEFEGKTLQSVTKGDLDLGQLESEEEKQEIEKASQDLKPFVERLSAALQDKVQEVRLTYRLTDSPACLVAASNAMDASMERLLKAAGQAIPSSKPVLEVNPHHALVKRLHEEKDEGKFTDWAYILFGQALISEGGQLEEPAEFVRRLNQTLLELAGDAPRIVLPG